MNDVFMMMLYSLERETNMMEMTKTKMMVIKWIMVKMKCWAIRDAERARATPR